MATKTADKLMKGLLLVALTAAPTGCTSLAPSLEGTRSHLVEGATLQIASRGAGHPTVVFEAGAGSGMSVWDAVTERVAASTSTFAYNRPGYGTSRSRRDPRSMQEVVEQLRQGLEAAGQSPPYLLVGHSLGGFYMNLFARTYPEEVAGVVLVDSTHPRQFEIFREEMPTAQSLLVASYHAGPVGRRYELGIIQRAQSEIEAADPFPPIPLVVLTAGKRSLGEKEGFRALWSELQTDLVRMSPLGRQVLASDCRHFIQKCDPDLVAHSILEILATVRGETAPAETTEVDSASAVSR